MASGGACDLSFPKRQLFTCEAVSSAYTFFLLVIGVDQSIAESHKFREDVMPTRPPGTPTVDLTDDDTFGTINDAVFMTGLYQPIPDQFSSFLEIRNNGTEQGYNTNGALQFNE